MLDARRLSALVCVARTGSLTAAARELGVTQPAISQQLRTLESECGLNLVVRAGRGVRLTAAGQLLASRATPILAAMASVEDELKALRRGETGRLRLLSVRSALVELVTPALAQARREHDGFSYKVEEMPFFGHGHLMEDLRRGECDLAVTVAGMEGLDDPDITSEPLVAVPLSAVVGRDHPLASASSITPADLVGAPVSFVADMIPVLDSSVFSDLHAQPDDATVTSDVPAALAIVRHSGAVALVPFQEGSLDDDMVAVPVEPSVSIQYVMAFRRHFPPTAAAKAAMTALVSRSEELAAQ